MARSRNIKPGLFKNELLGVADPMLTILFQGLWCLADREGRLEDRPLRIKAEIFPYREALDINGYLTELERLEFICRYSVEKLSIIQVINFKSHQNPHKTEKASTLPEIPKNYVKSDSCALTVKEPLKDGEITEDAVLIPDSLNLIPDTLSKNTMAEKSAREVKKDPNRFSDLFDMFWEAGMTKKKKKECFPVFQKLMDSKQGTELEFTNHLVNDIQQRVINRQLGFDEMHPTTYLRNDRWKDEFSLGPVSGFDQPKEQEGDFMKKHTDRSWREDHNDTTWAEGLLTDGQSSGDLDADLEHDKLNH